jgi:hypothetical protein
MRTTRLLAAGALSCAAAAPAFAAWDRIGSVDIAGRPGTEVQYGNFGGPVQALSLRARESDVTCRDVTAVFGYGDSRTIFHGPLPRGRDITLDLPDEGRMIRQLQFHCRSGERDGSRIDIAADVGRYQAEWRRSPDWDRMWSRMFHWDDRDNRSGDRYITGQLDTSNWITLGSERFEGRGDHEVAFPGANGRNIETIALRPVNDDARCLTVRVHFADGEIKALHPNGVMRQDRITALDLPGDRRNVTRIGMDCQAEHGAMVTMQVLASR